MKLLAALTVVFLLLAAKHTLGADPGAARGECATYRVSGRLLNPVLGRFEVRVNQGSKGQYDVRVFGLKPERALDFVDTRVAVTGVAEASLPGLLKSLKKCTLVGRAELADVEHHPVKRVGPSPCE